MPMRRAHVISWFLIGLFLASLVAWYVQPSAVDVARRHCREQGVAGEDLALLGYRGSGHLFEMKETVEFQVKGRNPPKKLVVELL